MFEALGWDRGFCSGKTRYQHDDTEQVTRTHGACAGVGHTGHTVSGERRASLCRGGRGLKKTRFLTQALKDEEELAEDVC